MYMCVCVCVYITAFKFKKNFSCFYLFLKVRERETEHEKGRSRERRRHRIRSRLQALSCQHRAQSGAWTHVPWDHDLSWSWTLNRLSHPGTPMLFIFETEREHTHKPWRGRQKGRENPKQAPGSELSTQSPSRGLNPQTARSWPKPKSVP